jgi:hypothetical protein
MAFQVRNQLNAGNATNNWSTKVAGAGAALLAGYSSPRRDPQGNPQQITAAWQAGVSAAAPKFQAGISGYDSTAAIASMQANGVPRYTAAGTTKKAKFSAFITAYAPTIQAGMAALPADRSSFAARQARSNAMQTYLHNNPYKKA